jgi:hypothetical protein
LLYIYSPICILRRKEDKPSSNKADFDSRDTVIKGLHGFVLTILVRF